MKTARISPASRLTIDPNHMATPGDYARVGGRFIQPSAEAVANFKAEMAKQKKAKSRPQPAVVTEPHPSPVTQAEPPATEPAAPAPVETEQVTIEKEEQSMTQIDPTPVVEAPAGEALPPAEPVTFAPSAKGRVAKTWSASELAELHQLYMAGGPTSEVEAAAGCKMSILRKVFIEAGLEVFARGRHPHQIANFGKRNTSGRKAGKSKKAKAAPPVTPAVMSQELSAPLTTAAQQELEGYIGEAIKLLPQMVEKIKQITITLTVDLK